MSSGPLIDLLDALLPFDKLRRDLAGVLSAAGGVELRGRWHAVPAACELTVLSRSFTHAAVATGFGSHFQAVVAAGGVASREHGIVTPGLCLATLWYDEHARLITIDFSDGLPP